MRNLDRPRHNRGLALMIARDCVKAPLLVELYGCSTHATVNGDVYTGRAERDGLVGDILERQVPVTMCWYSLLWQSSADVIAVPLPARGFARAE